MRAKRLPRLGLEAAEVEARLAAREAARQRRAFGEADAIRTEFEARGLDVRDGPDGTRWRVRL
ncbi:MAG: hypothetical protein HYV09_40375 [Deltaproteobacteria bacterium]|nr:hypothetical protein [Deltaproteobacteria bacterium]